MKYSEKTGDIRISVTPRHIDEIAARKKGGFQFSFTVTIANEGACDVVLLERYWVVNSGGEMVAEEVGPGVAGRRPVISAGRTFRYIGEAIIDDPVGSMQGTYTFRSTQGSYFQAAIPTFHLIYPEVLNQPEIPITVSLAEPSVEDIIVACWETMERFSAQEAGLNKANGQARIIPAILV